MLIGKAGKATTAISTADAASVTVRGRDLCGDLLGHVSFTEYFGLLMTGQMPSAEQVFFLDLLLVAIAEHGLVPTNQVARMTYAADPSSLQSAVAAGILGCGSVILGTSQACGEFLLAAAEACAALPGDDRAAVRQLATRIRTGGGKVPGFGHPLHKPVDPRAQRILELAEGASQSRFARLARVAEHVVPEVWGKALPMNVSMAIAAVLLDLGFPAGMLKSIPILARTASLLAHLAEEAENPIGFAMAAAGEAAIRYAPEAGS